MSTFISVFESGDEAGPVRVAVKDLIDIEGHVTTAGSQALAAVAKPAWEDAACLHGVRAAERRGEVRIIGKTNLDEFACAATGINAYFGTPRNPVDERLIPGGSSSGSAVAVASGLADIAIGTDTGGSVRIPAAACGVAGLKTTHGRVAVRGTYPLSPTLDTIGPIARRVDQLAQGLALLDPRFVETRSEITRIGRLRFPESETEIDRAVDAALALSGLSVEDVSIDGWREAHYVTFVLLTAEGWIVNRSHLEQRSDLVSAAAIATLSRGASVSERDLIAAHRYRWEWCARLDKLFARYDLLVSPTLSTLPPPVEDADQIDWPTFVRTMPVNLAGVPALAMPVPLLGSKLPASLQAIAPHWAESTLLTFGRHLEELILAEFGPDLQGP
ncbi:amidase [Sphaerobacter thermophilus]|uniref:amidase n=1 Tax=Sphaerobacter thermophilus TaxID=2057 RepID=UPI0039C232C1